MNEENSPFEPKALRQGEELSFRFKMQAEKALEKYKMAKRLEAQRRMRQLALEQMEIEGYSDAMGMYIIEPGKEKREASEVSSLTVTYGFRDGLMSCMKKILKSMYIEKKFELKWTQFLCITICLQISFSYTLKHMWLVCRWGAILVLLVYVIFGAFIAMPIYMILMFMGNYSRRSYIRFWDCVPLLKGVGYSIALTSILSELFSMTFAALSLNYLADAIVSSGTPWKGCSFPQASNDCRIYSEKSGPYNESCCIKGTANCSNDIWRRDIFKYEAYDYYKMYQMQNNYNEESVMLPMRIILCVGLVWIMMLGMMLLGLSRFRGFMTAISIALLIAIFAPWILATLYIADYSMFPELNPDWMDVFNYEFWVEVCIHSLHRELAGDVLTFSALSSPGISPTVDTICIYIMKFAFLIFITVWLSISVAVIQARYKIVHTNCLDVNGINVFFSLFPELLSSLSAPKIALIIYFFIIFFWCFSGALYTLNSFILSLLEQFPRLTKLKVLICSLFCVVCFFLNFMLLRSNLEGLYLIWVQNTCILTKVTLLFFTLSGIFLYSLSRVANDYHFTYGQKLHSIWLHGIKIAMLLITVVVVLKLTLGPGHSDTPGVIVLLCATLPTLIGACIIIVKYKTGSGLTVVAPDPAWGPIGFKRRLARSRFDPKRELRYRSAIQKCKHSCLLNSSTLVSEVKYWNNKRRIAFEFDP